MNTRPDPKDFVFGPDTTISDIDLDEEEFYYQGERLTEERAEQIAEETLARLRSGAVKLPYKPKQEDSQDQ